jgi:hypothetical protein
MCRRQSLENQESEGGTVIGTDKDQVQPQICVAPNRNNCIISRGQTTVGGMVEYYRTIRLHVHPMWI